MAIDKEVTSKRDKQLERMRQRYPDKKFEEDEEIFGQIGDDYDDYDNKIGEYQKREKAFSDLFNSDHRSAAFLQSWRDGNDPAVALMEMFGDDIIDAINDPEKMKEISEARKKYVDRVAQESKNTEEYKSNLASSLKTIEQYQQQKGYSDDQIDNVMENIIKVVGDAIMGKFETQTLDMFVKAQNYDTDVETAQAEGEVRGRNTKIEEKLRQGKKGDGLADLAGKNSAATPTSDAADLGALGNFGNQNTTIFERGGEKRRPIRR